MVLLDEGTLPDPRKYRKMAEAIRVQIDRGLLAVLEKPPHIPNGPVVPARFAPFRSSFLTLNGYTRLVPRRFNARREPW